MYIRRGRARGIRQPTNIMSDDGYYTQLVRYLGIDPFRMKNSMVVFKVWVIFLTIMSFAFSIHDGGLSYGSHIKVSTVKDDSEHGKTFKDMTAFINRFYRSNKPKDTNQDGTHDGERKYLSLAELGLSKHFEKNEVNDMGFDYEGNQMFKDYKYLGPTIRILDFMPNYNQVDMFPPGITDATPFYAYSNGLFRMDGTDVNDNVANRPTRDISYLSTCFGLVDLAQNTLYYSWIILFILGVLACVNSSIYWYYQKYGEAWEGRKPRADRIDACLLTIVNIVTVSAWAVFAGLWTTSMFDDQCFNLLQNHVIKVVVFFIIILTIGLVVTGIYISAAYKSAAKSEVPDVDKKINAPEGDAETQRKLIQSQNV